MEKVTVLDGLRGKNSSEKVTYGGTIINKLTDNSFFPDCEELVTDLEEATDDLKEINGTGTSSEIKTQEGIFDIAVQKIVLYIQGKILGVNPVIAKEMVESAGFKVKEKGSKHIEDISIEKDENQINTLVIRVKAVNKLDGKRVTVAYVWFRKSDREGDTEMKYLKTSTFATIHDKNLKPKVEYTYKCATVIGEDQSEFGPEISFIFG